MIYYVDNLADTIGFYHGLLKENGRLLIVLAARRSGFSSPPSQGGPCMLLPGQQDSLARLFADLSALNPLLVRKQRHRHFAEGVW